MGSRVSVEIETPIFNADEWEYLPAQEAIPQQYGIYRTLRNRKTGLKIDQYDVRWGSEEEFLYYLKSYNWRSRQPGVVQSRFLVQCNQQEICSYNYMASVYVEHIQLRLSDISDIPYPDNLYMLMQALEGYAAIYEHSKYFIIEENQICLDEEGYVKVWVNRDLSINYPAVIVENNSRFSQEDMVDGVVAIIAENTDSETQPKLTFNEYYKQKRGKGKTFEQARNLVFTYARLNNTEIPSRFEAIFNITHDDIDIKTFTQQSVADGRQRDNQTSGINLSHRVPQQEKQFYVQSLGIKQPILANTIYCSTNPTSKIIPPNTQHSQYPAHVSFGSKSQRQLLPYPQNIGESCMPVPVESEIYWTTGSQIQSAIPRFQSIYRNQQPSINFSNYPNTIESVVESQAFNSNLHPDSGKPLSAQFHNKNLGVLTDMPPNQVSYFIPNSKVLPIKREIVNTKDMFVGVQHIDAQSYLIPQIKQRGNSGLPQSTIMEQQNANKEDQIAKQNSKQASHDANDDDFASLEGSHINLENSVKKDDHNQEEVEDFEQQNVVGKSMPLKGYTAVNRRQLSTMDPPNKAVHSQIESGIMKSVTFGDRSDLKQKFKPIKVNNIKSFKYFSNLYEEFQIDPVIAADLAKLS